MVVLGMIFSEFCLFIDKLRTTKLENFEIFCNIYYALPIIFPTIVDHNKVFKTGWLLPHRGLGLQLTNFFSFIEATSHLTRYALKIYWSVI